LPCAYKAAYLQIPPFKAQEAKMESHTSCPRQPARGLGAKTPRKGLPDGTLTSKEQSLSHGGRFARAEFGPNATKSDAHLLDKWPLAINQLPLLRVAKYPEWARQTL